MSDTTRLIGNGFEISGCPAGKPSVDDASVCAQAAGTMRSVDYVVVGLAAERATPKARVRAPTRPMVACII